MNLKNKLQNTKFANAIIETWRDYGWIYKTEINPNLEKGFHGLVIASGLNLAFLVTSPIEIITKYFNKTIWGIKEFREEDY